MIDIENDIFNDVAAVLRAAHEGIYVVGEYVEIPARFPCVTIVEADNRVVQSMRTLNIENAILSMFEINIYSNKASGKKVEAKAIANTVDEFFASIGYTRIFRQQVPNLKDATIYRIVCRYEANVDKDLWIYHNNLV